MKFKIAIFSLFFTSNILACETHVQKKISSDHLTTGGRTGLHGMVIFGKGSYFIEHIPMFHAPHDFQIVASIQIKNKMGDVLKPDFSQKGFTLKPKNNFSLNDFIRGELKNFQADIFLGSFEQDGIPISSFEDISIEVLEMKLVRKLPDNSKEVFFEVTDTANNVYRTGIITPVNNKQVITNMGLKKNLWCVLGPDFFESC